MAELSNNEHFILSTSLAIYCITSAVLISFCDARRQSKLTQSSPDAAHLCFSICERNLSVERLWPTDKLLRTNYDHFDIIQKSIDNFKRLGHCPSSCVRMCRTPSISLFPSSFFFFCEFLYATSSLGTSKRQIHLLNLSCLICLEARARTESNSTIIFMLIFVIVGVKERSQ